jgi:nanoRNase/pAp phosphatase (c-di-AMP/oligoRNAs hydrolase)
VDGVARSFGGGGHHKAAGAELPGPLESARETVLARVRKLIGEVG